MEGLMMAMIKLSHMINPHFYPMWTTDKPYVICKGGRGSFKSSVISMRLVTKVKHCTMLGQIRDGLGGDEPIVLVSKVNPYDYHPVDFRDTTFELEDWQEAVKLAHELAMTPLDQRGEKMEPDWIKHAKWWFHSVLGRAYACPFVLPSRGCKTCLGATKRIIIAFITHKRGKPLESKSWPAMATSVKCVSGPAG